MNHGQATVPGMERQTYSRAKLQAGGTYYDRVRFVLRDGLARAFDTNGSPVEQGEVAAATVGASVTTLTLTDGTEWTATKRGCNCGGR